MKSFHATAPKRKTLVHRMHKLARKVNAMVITPAPERLLVLRGLRRSGNHAVSNVLRSCAEVCFRNNIVQAGPNLLPDRESPGSQVFLKWCKRAGVNRRNLLVSLEDHPLRFEPFRDVRVPRTDIIVIRDPYNLLASRLMKAMSVDQPGLYPRENNVYLQRITMLWKEYARECLGDSHGLEAAYVYFNAWVRSAEYRKSVIRELGLEACNGDAHQQVSVVGGGSSFDGVEYDGSAASMDVGSRWERLPEDVKKIAHEAVRDDELCILAERLERQYGAWSADRHVGFRAG
jgi:hypothetical protein